MAFSLLTRMHTLKFSLNAGESFLERNGKSLAPSCMSAKLHSQKVSN